MLPNTEPLHKQLYRMNKLHLPSFCSARVSDQSAWNQSVRKREEERPKSENAEIELLRVHTPTFTLFTFTYCAAKHSCTLIHVESYRRLNVHLEMSGMYNIHDCIKKLKTKTVKLHFQQVNDLLAKVPFVTLKVLKMFTALYQQNMAANLLICAFLSLCATLNLHSSVSNMWCFFIGYLQQIALSGGAEVGDGEPVIRRLLVQISWCVNTCLHYHLPQPECLNKALNCFPENLCIACTVFSGV